MNFKIEEATIKDIQDALESGEITSRSLVLMYLERIAELDQSGPSINSVLELNPDVLFIAEALDYERKAIGSRGPMHGVPVLIKDNIDTHDKMHTSAGSLALANSYAPADAFLVSRLREAGAIILGKSNMTEFANFMTEGMLAGYSSRGGQVLNPYKSSASPGGSSSGSGASVACSFCTVAIGTETLGSILSPANQNSIVGIKPTVGLISRSGIIPITNSQDTAGPMARTVEDAALLLGALTGVDQRDPATWAGEGRYCKDYTRYLDKAGLKGARIGLASDDLSEDEQSIMNGVIDVLKMQGASVIDSIKLPASDELYRSSVLMNEFKSSINAYLGSLGANTPVRTLKDIIDFNNDHPMETLKYGQKLLMHAEYKTSGKLTEPEYLRDRIKDLRLSQTEGIDAAMKEHSLDALLFPGIPGIPAIAGYPAISVPAGYKPDGIPFGVTFAAGAYSEPVIIKLAYAFEQATQARVAPRLK